MTENLTGRVINNRFRIDTYINSQGTTPVYKAWDLQEDAPLLMKLVSSSYESDPASYNQVVRKANTLRKLSHPNINYFYGLYKAKDFSFTLEKYIHGTSLDQLMRKQEEGHFSVKDSLIIIKAVSAALVYAHSAGVVHGNVRPENILVSADGNIYLTGFNVNYPTVPADVQPDLNASADQSLARLPEGGLAAAAAATADIYAVGVLLYHLLTGEWLPGAFPGENEITVSKLAKQIWEHQSKMPDPSLWHSISETSDELAAVIEKAVAKNPAERYPSVKIFFWAACKAARVFANEIPDRLWAGAVVPVTSIAATTYPVLADVDELSRGSSPSLRPYFRFSPAGMAVFGAVFSVLLIGGLLFFLGVFNRQRSPKVLPGYAYIDGGEVTYQVPGGQPKVYQKGASISFGPGALTSIGKTMATLVLPGDYRIFTAGNPKTVFELVQQASGQSTTSILNLFQGSLFLIAGEGVDTSRPVYIQTVSGRAILAGSIMGIRFDNYAQILSVDCIQGPCRLEADEIITLTTGQRSQVDSSGIPVPPSPINLGLYPEYKLSFLPAQTLGQTSTPSLKPLATPTPHPTIEFTPTLIPPTWTPTPTLAPKTGYGH